MSEIAVVAPCFYSNTDSIAAFLRSAEKQNIAVNLYGVGQAYTNFAEIKGVLLERFIRENIKSEIVLLTDAGDVLFMRGLAEIGRRYAELGSPKLLMSAETNCYPCSGPSRNGLYLNAGGYMGSRDYILNRLQFMIADNLTQGGVVKDIASGKACDQGWFQRAWGRGNIEITLDVGSRIFHTMYGANRQFNPDACLLHLNGRSGDINDWYRKLYEL